MLDEIGDCTHRAPSPGQSVCSCRHSLIELQYLAAVLERARDERLAAVERLAETWQGELDSGAIRDPDARYCWGLAARELRAALGKEAS